MAAISSATDVGVGFKPQHLAAILAARQPLRFFEVHAENYMGEGGPPLAQLAALRECYALSLHGVGLSIGGDAPLDRAHLKRLRVLCDRFTPRLFSEHLAWSSHGDAFLNDLLPLPYDEHSLARVAHHVDEVQEALGRPILIENPSTYLAFAASSMAEGQFLDALCRRTGCGLLLDVANVFVSATNHGCDALALLRSLPLDRVGEIHLAGHARAPEEDGTPLLIDTHDSPVPDPVWALYREALALTGPVPTLIEWDNDVPAWPVLLAEALGAAGFLAAAARRNVA